MGVVTKKSQKLRFSGALESNKFRDMRTIFELSAENAKIADCLAEGGGFESSTPHFAHASALSRAFPFSGEKLSRVKSSPART
jgi:hypothetical protein